MGVGRKPKPTALHKLHGTFRDDLHGAGREREAIAEGDLVEPPVDLTESQADIWRYAIEHAPKGIAKMIDRDLLRIWVEASDRHNTARLMQAMIDRDSKLKLVVKGPMGLLPSPYNSILDKTAMTMIRVAQDLGFSPAARPRLKTTLAPSRAPEAADPNLDPWSALQVIQGGREN